MQIGTQNFLEEPRVQELMKASPLKDTAQNPDSLIVFRRLIECAMSQGRWMGKMPEVS